MATNPDFNGTVSPIDALSRICVRLCWFAVGMIGCRTGIAKRTMPRDGETERLVLRPLRMADAPQIQERFPHWQVVRYLLDRVPWPYPADGAHRYVSEFALPAIAREIQWTWTLRLKSKTAQIIGTIDLRRGDEDNRGFWIGVDWQGRGLMSEACVWVNDYWFDTLGFRLMRVAKAADNAASRRLSEKQGMRLVGVRERNYVCGRLPTEVWEITAEEWSAWKAASTRQQKYEQLTLF
jgi:[ribosomal protein S5]-alanine N-acetyltransferase